MIMLMALLSQLTGCATVQKKFTRKKKEPAHVAAAIYFEEGPYQKKYSNVYYYKSHYTLWKTWHEDLVKGIGGNRRKTQRNAEETLNHLTEMRNYLIPEKQKELDPLVAELTQYAKKFETGAYSKSEEPGMRTELEKIRRLVNNDFYYDKVTSQILPDKVDLAAPAAPTASALPAPIPVPIAVSTIDASPGPVPSAASPSNDAAAKAQ